MDLINLEPVAGVFSSGGFDAEIAAGLQRYGFRGSSREDLIKAIVGDGGTDHAALSGGSALRKESLEASLLRTTQEAKHLVGWRLLPKSDATAMQDEWTRDRDIGGIEGSGFNAELADMPESSGDYDREIGKLALLTDLRRVSGVAEEQGIRGLASAVGLETDKGSMKILTDANWGIYFGDSACNRDEFDGLDKQLRAVGGDQIIDLRGEPINGNGRQFDEAALRIWGMGHYGQVTDYICSGGIQADLDHTLDGGHRVLVDGTNRNAVAGTPIVGVHTNWGDMKKNNDPFLIEGQAPFIARGSKYAAFVTGSGVAAPATVAGTRANNAASQFQTAHAGAYYYAVEAGGANGKRSALVKSGIVNVVAGDRVTLTITPNAGNNAICYWVFRSRRNGTSADNDFRQMIRLPANGDTAVVYLDDNQNIPGTSVVPILTVGGKAIDIRRLGDQKRIPLYAAKTWEHRWGHVMIARLRLGKENQHILMINALPSRQEWRPF